MGGSARNLQQEESVGSPVNHSSPIMKNRMDLEGELHSLRETVAILTEKNKKLEQLVQIKDLKIKALQEKLTSQN
jgi:hypothetical protein